MKVIQSSNNVVLSRMSHANAINHINEMFPGSRTFFNGDCISAMSLQVKDGNINSSSISYDKICVETESSRFFWPIDPYTEDMDPSNVLDFINKCRV